MMNINALRSIRSFVGAAFCRPLLAVAAVMGIVMVGGWGAATRAATASQLAATINSAGLSASVSGNTVTVSGTLSATLSSGNFLTLNIDDGVTVRWQATLQGSPSSSNALVHISGGSGAFIMSGGRIENTGTGRAISNNSACAVTISGGTVTTASNTAIVNSSSSGTVTIAGGTVSVTGSRTAISNSGTLNVSGGTVSTESGTAISGGTVNITRGTVSATTGTAVSFRKLTVSGGTVSATTGSALYGGYADTATISSGALITSANSGSSGTIMNHSTLNINGGTIRNTVANATGANGVAISASSLGTINITGGTVSATSGHAISGGSDINISGGTITTSGSGKYAINNNGSRTVTVTGGTLSAPADGYAVYNSSNGSMRLGRSPTISERIYSFPERLSVLTSADGADAFAPGGRRYTLDFPADQYVAARVAVVNGSSFLNSFVLHNSGFALSVQGPHLGIAAASATRTVSFDLNGGIGTLPRSFGVSSGSRIPISWKPSTTGFTKSGHGNDGEWYTSATDQTDETKFVFDAASGTQVTSNMTLYLRWVETTLSISTEQLATGAFGTPYSQTLAAVSNLPVTWSITSGALPAGLTLNASTGVISGTVNAFGNFTFTVRASNGFITVTREFTISTTSALMTLLEEGFEGGASIPDGWTQNSEVGMTEWTFVTASTGTPATVRGGVRKAYMATGGGEISKLITPQLDISGLASPTLTFWHTQAAQGTDQDKLSVYYKTSSTGAWVLLEEYTGNIATWTQRTIALPNASAAYYIAFEGSVDYGHGIQLDDVRISHIVTPAAPTITTASLPIGKIETAYSYRLTSTSLIPVTWSVEAGSLPNGLTLNSSTGVISGTPATAAYGIFPLTIKAVNGMGDDSKEFTLSVGIDDGEGGIVIPTAPIITTASMANGIFGDVYSQTLVATSLTPVTWSVDYGTLPAGLTLTPSTGEISGTLNAYGVFAFTVKAANSVGSDIKELSITTVGVLVDGEIVVPEPPVITTASLPGGVFGTAYNQTLTATSIIPITWSIDNGDLPDGLTLNPSTGVIAGTLSSYGEFPITVRAANGVGDGVTEDYTIIVSGVLQTHLEEGFEAGVRPANWTEVRIAGNIGWSFVSAATGTPATAQEGDYKARFYSETQSQTRLITPALDLSGLSNPGLLFSHTQTASGNQDVLRIYYRTTASGDWTLLEAYTDNVADWTQRLISLPSASATYFIAFEAESNNGGGVQLDDVKIVHVITPPAPEITTASLPYGKFGLTYNETFSANSKTPVTWSIVNGNLPTGLTLDPSTGAITGMFTEAGTFTFTVKADNKSSTDEEILSIEVRMPHTVTFDANGGEVAPQSGTTVYGWTLAELPEPIRSGYAFIGWFTAATGGVEVTTDMVFDENATIYARWVQIPVITAQPSGGGSIVTNSNRTLYVSANVTDGGTLSYQWYKNTMNSNVGGTAISGATSATYTLNTPAAGTHYYYVVVTNTKFAGTVSIASSVETMTVNVASDAPRTVYFQFLSNSTSGGWNGARIAYEIRGVYWSWTPTSNSIGQTTLNVGDRVDVFWLTKGTTDNQCAFAVYYADTPPNPAFNPASGAQNDWSSILVSRQYGSLGSVTANTTLGTFTVSARPGSVARVNAYNPIISTPLANDTVFVGKTHTLSVSANLNDEGTLSYQWYRNTTASNTGGTAIVNATDMSYLPNTDEIGTFYYYVVVTNTNNGITGNNVATTTSNVATLVVSHPTIKVSVSPAAGGNASANLQSAISGTEIKLTATHNSGYHFAEWDIISGNISLADASASATIFTMPDEAVEVKAIFVLNTYAITYELNDGIVTTANPENYNITTPAFTLNNPTKEGYVFIGWTGTNGTTPQINVSVAQGSIGERTYAANWIQIYTISYILNGGNVAIANPTTYTIETGTFTLRNPTRDNYTFAGWTGANGTTPQTSVSIAQGSIGDREYIANWTPIIHTISYNLNGGIATSDNPTAYTIETPTFTLNNPTRTGFTFAGWTGANGTTPETEVTVEQGSVGARSYIANWSIVTYTISYDLNGGIVATANPTSYTIWTATFWLTNPTRTGYTFAGWTGTNGITPQTSVTITRESIGDREYTANWTPIARTISYNLNGGTITSENPTSYTIETAPFTLNNPTREGYEFAGWICTTWATYVNGGHSTVWSDLMMTVNIIPQSSYGVTITGVRRSYTAHWSLITDAATPTIATQPSGGTVKVGDAHTLSVSASVGDGGTLSYQWYSNTAASNTGGTLISGAVFAEYSPSTATVGTFYYYVVITNTNNSVNGEKTAAIASSVATVAVGPVSILSSDRTIPDALPETNVAVIPPVNVSAFEVTVGPNPVRKSDNGVNIFITGKRIDDGTLTVYDALGNVVGKVNVNGEPPRPLRGHPATAGNNVNGNVDGERRIIGTWDLRDAKGRAVPEGTYLLRGTVKTVDGKRERVSVVVGVR